MINLDIYLHILDELRVNMYTYNETCQFCFIYASLSITSALQVMICSQKSKFVFLELTHTQKNRKEVSLMECKT